ncbi:MAG: lysine transporter LysE [Flavobacteriales bacterium]|nr:MAG: lysine transporter LysE [Flavobacteriales bacterium]
MALSPGPDNIYVLVQGVSKGVKYGLATVYGLISGCVVHTTLVAFGAAAIIRQNENLFLALKIFGSLYLLFLAYKTYKTYKSNTVIHLNHAGANNKNTLQLFKQGFLMNVLNPKVSLFFLAFFPGFLFSENLSPLVQFFILGGIFMATSLIVFSGIAILSGSIAGYINKHPKANSYLKWLQIIIFIGIAGYILFV